MFGSDRKEENSDMRRELGLSDDRGLELMDILSSIENRDTKDGKGRTSHVLLDISVRKDLSDLEKVVCAFIFSCKHFDSSLIMNKDDNLNVVKPHKIVSSQKNTNVNCVVMTPGGVDNIDIMVATVSVLLEQLKQVPQHEAIDFCDRMSKILANIARTGKIEL